MGVKEKIKRSRRQRQTKATAVYTMKFESLSTRLQKMLAPHGSPLGCDTFVALPPATPPGTTIFGKNSDRPCGEGQSVRRYPAADHPADCNLQCTYISIPQVQHTYAVLLSQIGTHFRQKKVHVP